MNDYDSSSVGKRDPNSMAEESARKRGYSLLYHRVLAAHDQSALAAIDNAVEELYLQQRELDRLTKELVLIGVLTAVGAPHDQIANHMRLAQAAGASAALLLETLELAYIPAGGVRFNTAMAAWVEACEDRGV